MAWLRYTEFYDPVSNDESKCVYTSDADLFAWIKEGIKDKARTPIEGQIADWADQMAYSINDMEDVVRAGLISFADLRSLKNTISKDATKKFLKSRKKRGESEDLEIPALLNADAIEVLANNLENAFITPGSLRQRKINLKKWTSDTIKQLKDGCEIRALDNDEQSVRYQSELFVPRAAEAQSILLKTIAFSLVFSDPRVKTLEEKGKLVMETLFDKFCENTALLPLDFQEMIQSEEEFGTKERLVADFISGMTDRYAYAYYSRLTQPGIGSFYEFV